MKRMLTGAVAILAGVATAWADWPQWRGPEQCGFSRDHAVVTTWSRDGENVLWKSDVGGRTTPIVLGRRVYVITPVGTGVEMRERVVCLDADTGKTDWEYAFPVFHTDIVENRVGFTSLAGDTETGNIYAHGTGGELFCLSPEGKVIWKQALAEDFGRVSGYGGRLHTPVIDEDRVIISFTCSGWGEYAKPAHRYYAFNKHDGRAVWSAAPGGPPSDTTCACPTVAVIGGRRLLIAPNVDGNVYAMLSRTGETVWSYPFSKRPLNTMPVVQGERVYLIHSEENHDTTVMGAAACIDGSKTGKLDSSAEFWRVTGVEAGYAAPALANGRLYVVDNSANLLCFDGKSGNQLWRQKIGNLGKGAAAVTADGIIYVGSQEEKGLFWILRDAGASCEVLDQEEFPRTDLGLDEVLGSPAVSDGRVYFQTRYATYCLGKKDAKVRSDSAPEAPAESRDQTAGTGTVLLFPHETTLAPGETLKLATMAFSPGGLPAPSSLPSDAQWSVAGVKGEWKQQEMAFVAAPDALFSAGAVKMKMGDKESVARVRVCPRPPFAVDFEDYAVDATPPGWLSVIAKTKVVEKDGSKALQKLAERPSPPFMRIRAYMTPPIAGGYTIEADVLGGMRKTAIKEFWPDMGVINSRYEFFLLGEEAANPKARLVTWAPIPRLQKDAAFDWKPGVWYRLKFQVDYDDGQALLRAKAWPRDAAEPAEWLIEATDPSPNLEGSPGLYGYSNGTTEKSKGAEIWYDNVRVY